MCIRDRFRTAVIAVGIIVTLVITFHPGFIRCIAPGIILPFVPVPMIIVIVPVSYTHLDLNGLYCLFFFHFYIPLLCPNRQSIVFPLSVCYTVIKNMVTESDVYKRQA